MSNSLNIEVVFKIKLYDYAYRFTLSIKEKKLIEPYLHSSNYKSVNMILKERYFDRSEHDYRAHLEIHHKLDKVIMSFIVDPFIITLIN